MIDIKKRIKRALAGLLREELLEYIGYNHNIPYMTLNDRFTVNQLPFETAVMETEIPLQDFSNSPYNDPTFLEKHIEKCKREFSEKVLEHIHVETQNLTSHEYFMRRSVKFILRVQSKK